MKVGRHSNWNVQHETGLVVDAVRDGRIEAAMGLRLLCSMGWKAVEAVKLLPINKKGNPAPSAPVSPVHAAD